MTPGEASPGAYLVEVDGRWYFLHKLCGRGWSFMGHLHQTSPVCAVRMALEGGCCLGAPESLDLLLRRYPGIRVVREAHSNSS